MNLNSKFTLTAGILNTILGAIMLIYAVLLALMAFVSLLLIITPLIIAALPMFFLFGFFCDCNLGRSRRQRSNGHRRDNDIVQGRHAVADFFRYIRDCGRGNDTVGDSDLCIQHIRTDKGDRIARNVDCAADIKRAYGCNGDSLPDIKRQSSEKSKRNGKNRRINLIKTAKSKRLTEKGQSFLIQFAILACKNIKDYPYAVLRQFVAKRRTNQIISVSFFIRSTSNLGL